MSGGIYEGPNGELLHGDGKPVGTPFGMNRPKPAKEMTDEELFDAIREQVNRSRNFVGHDRERTREIAEEMQKRGWGKTKAKPQ